MPIRKYVSCILLLMIFQLLVWSGLSFSQVGDASKDIRNNEYIVNDGGGKNVFSFSIDSNGTLTLSSNRDPIPGYLLPTSARVEGLNSSLLLEHSDRQSLTSLDTFQLLASDKPLALVVAAIYISFIHESDDFENQLGQFLSRTIVEQSTLFNQVEKTEYRQAGFLLIPPASFRISKLKVWIHSKGSNQLVITVEFKRNGKDKKVTFYLTRSQDEQTRLNTELTDSGNGGGNNGNNDRHNPDDDDSAAGDSGGGCIGTLTAWFGSWCCSQSSETERLSSQGSIQYGSTNRAHTVNLLEAIVLKEISSEQYGSFLQGESRKLLSNMLSNSVMQRSCVFW